MSGLMLDFEAADRITLLTLQEHLMYLREEIRLHEVEGQYIHPEDYQNSLTKLIPALEVLIPYYGGEV